MERISYAGDSVLTGTAIAHAVLAYAEALATRKASATVDIPVRLPDGTQGRAAILIGPASQLISHTDTGEDGDELVDDELVERLTVNTRALDISRPVTEENDANSLDLDILSYDPTDPTAL